MAFNGIQSVESFHLPAARFCIEDKTIKLKCLLGTDLIKYNCPLIIFKCKDCRIHHWPVKKWSISIQATHFLIWSSVHGYWFITSIKQMSKCYCWDVTMDNWIIEFMNKHDRSHQYTPTHTHIQLVKSALFAWNSRGWTNIICIYFGDLKYLMPVVSQNINERKIFIYLSLRSEMILYMDDFYVVYMNYTPIS